MAKGLCRKCGEKWSKGRRCAASVQLNIIQEVWDLIDPDHSDLHESNPKDSQLFMVLSVAALDGIEAPRTLKIMRLIQGVEILILVDSGTPILSLVRKWLHQSHQHKHKLKSK
jgi:hypothetical protein